MTNWEKNFDNSLVLDAYTKFVNGEMTRRQMEAYFKNTAYAGDFRALVRSGGINRAKTLANKALKRRALI
jgi:hypothetical protein